MPGLFSSIPRVNARFLALIADCGSSPYDAVPRAARTVDELVERVRLELGQRAARSIKVTLH
jgi:hypothetical protein